MSKENSFILGAAMILSSVLFSFILSQALLQFQSKERTVIVKGLSQQEVNADVMILPLKFTRVNNDLSSLYKALKEDQNQISHFLKEQGANLEDITLGAPSIQDKFENFYENDGPIQYRYIGTSTILLATHDIELGRKILQNIASVGEMGIALKIDNYAIEYRYTKLNEIKPQMIEEATLNAREAALKFAQDSQSKLGKIKKATQGQFTITNRDENTPYIKEIRVVSTIEYYLED